VRKSGSWGGGWREEKFVWIPLVAAFGMYALVHVEPRFVGGFGLMLLMRLLAGVRFEKQEGKWALSGLASVIILAPALATVISTGKNSKDILRPATFEQWEVARGLHEMGIPQGMELGYIGTGLGAYWAHLSGVRIIAEIPDKEQPRFVAADAARRQQVLALFSSVGVKAVVTKNAAAANPADGWRQIPGTHYFVWQEPWLIAAPEKK